MRLLPILFLLALASPASAATRQYALAVPPSAYVVGCQGPCDCAIVSQPTYGSFELVPTGFDGLYDTYRVERYVASFNNGPGAVALTGTGTFKIGGEFALTQRMTLDLTGPGGRTFHVDSGIVPVSAAFPKIEIECPAHGFACYDTVVIVAGAPVGTVDVPPGVTAPAIVRVTPNPFGRETTIQLAFDPGLAVDVRVMDVAGRIVRRLPAAGIVRWDGRRDSGATAAPGTYWLLVRGAAGADARRLVKIE